MSRFFSNRKAGTAVAVALLAVGGAVVLSQGGSSSGLLNRVPWTTSRVVGSPDPLPPYQLVRAFSQFQFKNPIFIAQDPTSDRFFVAEFGGRIFSFHPSDSTGKKDLFLDLKRSISAFSFHPGYARNGQVFVFSSYDTRIAKELGGGQEPPEYERVSRVYRFELDRESDPPRLLPESSTVIIEWPGGGHDGGEAIIGPDGYLYISTGDGTGGSDRLNTGQGVDDLLAVMMRLDVDRPDPGRAYSIPKDNPFIHLPDARPEIWAFGFRNPWRFSFDPVTGRPWVGDVGQDLWEMIELSGPGFNHGWSVKEGSYPFHPNKKPHPTPIVPPVVEHHHTECRSITGGYVYEGDKFPELQGAYLYGDYQYGKMWGLRYDHQRGQVTWHEELADTAVKISSFGLGRDGAFYALDYDRGEIYRLERQAAQTGPNTFPRLLSETGIFSSVKEHRVAPGVIPYSINAPFWSDGAEKERFLAIPGSLGIEFSEDRAWSFDDGTVTVKSFSLEMEEGNPASRRYIETRIVVKQDDHWVGYTYAWNDDQTDAELVEAGGLDRSYDIRDRSAPGGLRKQTWHYPSRTECMFCHSRAAGFVLGLNTAQMNRDHGYGEIRGNQIDIYRRLGLFKNPLEKAAHQYPAYPDPFDPKADLGARVKTYLAVNCAICHVSDGGGNSKIELGWKTPMEKANLIGEAPLHDNMGIADARLVAPGDPARSILYRRIITRGVNQMPPSSTNLVDEAGARLIFEWISSLDGQKTQASGR